MAADMFRSVYGSFDKQDEGKEPKDRTDGQGEPLKKPSRTSEVTHSLNVHGDGSASTHTPQEGLKMHDSYESASEHMSQSVGKGDNFGMEHEAKAGSSPSKLTQRGPRDDMSGSEM
jgi:hypothetical protein